MLHFACFYWLGIIIKTKEKLAYFLDKHQKSDNMCDKSDTKDKNFIKKKTVSIVC